VIAMTMRAMGCVPVMVGVMATALLAQQRGGRGTPAKPAVPPSEVRAAECVSDLGKGVKTSREFCDVIVAATGADSVSMSISAHTGPATLFFDLHPRFEVLSADGDPGRLFQRHTAVVAVVGPTGDVIDRIAAAGEFRSPADLFDRMAGTTPGGLKVVAPGLPTHIKVTIPAGVTSIGIVGLRVEIMTRFNQQAFPDPGRPVAIISNWRIEYIPR
jgi:hypothetical protein